MLPGTTHELPLLSPPAPPPQHVRSPSVRALESSALSAWSGSWLLAARARARRPSTSVAASLTKLMSMSAYQRCPYGLT
eukprot:366119-Chlamydomonas_euryale.AAC.25